VTRQERVMYAVALVVLILALILMSILGGMALALAPGQIPLPQQPPGTGSNVGDWLGGATGLTGTGIVGYLLVRYLPKRDEALMKALKEKDEAHAKALERQAEMWQRTVDAIREDNRELVASHEKLRAAILHLAKQPGMTNIAHKAME